MVNVKNDVKCDDGDPVDSIFKLGFYNYHKVTIMMMIMMMMTILMMMVEVQVVLINVYLQEYLTQSAVKGMITFSFCA